MTVNLEQKGLSSIVNEFDLFFIDIWGVVHNGINLYTDAIDVLEKLNYQKKDYILLTNAPRPNTTVINFLKKMGLANIHCEKVYTSGEAALIFLKKNFSHKVGVSDLIDFSKLNHKRRKQNE